MKTKQLVQARNGRVESRQNLVDRCSPRFSLIGRCGLFAGEGRFEFRQNPIRGNGGGLFAFRG